MRRPQQRVGRGPIAPEAVVRPALFATLEQAVATTRIDYTKSFPDGFEAMHGLEQRLDAAISIHGLRTPVGDYRSPFGAGAGSPR